MKFDWLLDLLPSESATPTQRGVAASVAEIGAVHSRTQTPAHELPHLPPPKGSEVSNDADRLTDLAEQLTERAAILEYDAGLARAQADVTAARIVQCSKCQHWTADSLGGGGIGSCATGDDEHSWSAFDSQRLPAWPQAPRRCTSWQAIPITSDGGRVAE